MVFKLGELQRSLKLVVRKDPKRLHYTNICEQKPCETCFRVIVKMTTVHDECLMNHYVADYLFFFIIKSLSVFY